MRSFPWCSRRSKSVINPPLPVEKLEKEVAAVVEEMIKSVEVAPVEVATVEVAPVEAAPVEAAPVEAAPVEVAPVEPAAVELAVKKSKKLPAHMYTHKIWPSPRAVNFVRAILKENKGFANSCKIEGRLSHEKALNALASFANITVDELLTVAPGMYFDKYLNQDYKNKQLPKWRNYDDYMRGMIIF